MKTILWLVAGAAMTTATVQNCSMTDYAPLALQATACSTASGTTFSGDAASLNLTQAISLCQFSSCEALFADLGTLECTEAGIPVSLAATICDSYVAPPETPTPRPIPSGSAPTGLVGGGVAVAVMLMHYWS